VELVKHVAEDFTKCKDQAWIFIPSSYHEKKTMQGILEDRMSTPAEVSFSGMSPTGCYALQSML
jgi:tryptophanyl-tRNA synthetase